MSVAEAAAAAFFAQSVARLLALPGAEEEAVRCLRAEDLPDLLAHLRERLAQARAEGEAAGRAAERAAVVAYLRERAVDADTTLDVCNVLLTLIGDIRRGDHIAAADADSNNNAPEACR